MPTRRISALAIVLLAAEAGASEEEHLVSSRTVDGYRGIWFDLGQRSKFGSKYSGGLGTYTAKHIPIAVYAPEVSKTFFVYGGTTREDADHLLAMASYYDHERGVVPRPTVVHDKGGVNDPHDNPAISIDERGYVWVFVSGRGRRRPGFKYVSLKPWSVTRFERVCAEEFTYPQPWWIKGSGFLLLFTKYTRGRELYWATSADGRTWSQHKKLAGMGGHYQVSAERRGRIITAFSMHPDGNVDRRTNLYFLTTNDMGKTWRTVDGAVVEPPVVDPNTPALVRDYRRERRLVYLKDIAFDRSGHPVILHITSASYQPGPQSPPRYWTVAHWKNGAWVFHRVTTAGHNYDMGSLFIEKSGTWRIIGPTEPGPQLHGTGGEMAVWTSSDEGRTWRKTRDVTRGSRFNHTYARRPLNARDDFYAFWADGDPDTLSKSRLYFTDKTGLHTRVLPYDMKEAFAVPGALPHSPDPR